MENNHNIEELVAEKDFAQLSDTEKAMVIKELGNAEAYTEMRNFILAFRDEDEVEVPLAMRQNVMNAYDEQQKKSSNKKIIPLWNHDTKTHKQPLVYVLVAASLLFAVFIFLPDSNTGLKPQLAENKSKKEIVKSKTPETEKASAAETAAPQVDKTEDKKSTPSAPSSPQEMTTYQDDSESEFAEEEVEIVRDVEIELKDAPAISEDRNTPNLAPQRSEQENSFSDAITHSKTDDMQSMSTSEILTKSAKNQARTQENEFSVESTRASADKSMKSIPLVSFRVSKFENDHYTGF